MTARECYVSVFSDLLDDLSQ